jgi:hypothetical protein
MLHSDVGVVTQGSRHRHRKCRVLRFARPCTFCHVPYPHRTAPFANMRIVPCRACGRK